jgi:site-specific DNA recombinase
MHPIKSVGAPALRAAAYGRVSTEEQRDRETIKTQVEVARHRCERDGLPIHDYYLDDGVSGTLPLEQRPEGARLLADARAGLFNVLVIYKVDRLGRDIIVTLSALREIHALGVTIISATETLDLSNPAGWAMAAVISAFGQLERENFLARSKEATDRLAHEGVWLGGIVPYGYRVDGKDKGARLIVSNDPIPGFRLSEADVIRLIYRMITRDGMKCQQIAEHLNALGIPPAYTRDERLLLKSDPFSLLPATEPERTTDADDVSTPVTGAAPASPENKDPLKGKRKERTQGIWRAGRILNMAKNTTYKGVHFYGKRSAKPRALIERAVPAIVSEEEWEKAQMVLRSNMVASPRNATRLYLLRGLIRCGTCGLNYFGTAYQKARGEVIYYTCSGKSMYRAHYGSTGCRCNSKAVQGTLEDLVWDEVRGFICNPGDVLRELEESESQRPDAQVDLTTRIRQTEAALRAKAGEANQVVALYRKGLIAEDMLASQLEEVRREERTLQEEIGRLATIAAQNQSFAYRSAQTTELLANLRTRMEEPVSREMKRQLIECLVKSIQIETVEEKTERWARVHVHYSFEPPTLRAQSKSVKKGAHIRRNTPVDFSSSANAVTANCTGTDSSRRRVGIAKGTEAIARRVKS